MCVVLALGVTVLFSFVVIRLRWRVVRRVVVRQFEQDEAPAAPLKGAPRSIRPRRNAKRCRQSRVAEEEFQKLDADAAKVFCERKKRKMKSTMILSFL